MIKTRRTWQMQVRPCQYCGKLVYFDVSFNGNPILLEFVTQERHYCRHARRLSK